MDVVLVGGGRDLAALVNAPAGLADALRGGPLLGLAADDGEGVDAGRWHDLLTASGVQDVRVLRIADERPPTASDLAGFAGVYVAGGLTPLYARLLAPLRGAWPDGVYGGFSAGAAVAAPDALVGGWRLDGREVAPEDAAEDLDELTVASGLGLVPFGVEVHATQWGTLARAVHAVASGRVAEVWALDEGTGLHVRDGRVLSVRGAGHAYRVTRADAGVRVEPCPAGPPRG